MFIPPGGRVGKAYDCEVLLPLALPPDLPPVILRDLGVFVKIER